MSSRQSTVSAAASYYDGNSNAAVNIQALVPTIALERMEVVKDGASALYGSDAIAGVVNLHWRKILKGWMFSSSTRSLNKSAPVTPITLR